MLSLFSGIRCKDDCETAVVAESSPKRFFSRKPFRFPALQQISPRMINDEPQVHSVNIIVRHKVERKLTLYNINVGIT